MKITTRNVMEMTPRTWFKIIFLVSPSKSKPMEFFMDTEQKGILFPCQDKSI